MNVIDKIIDELSNFSRDTGKKPTRIYLGADERAALNNPHLPIYINANNITLLGMELFFVYTKNHIGVS